MVLNIDGAVLDNARVIVKPGGKINLINGGVIKPRDEYPFMLLDGGQLKIDHGKIMN